VPHLGWVDDEEPRAKIMLRENRAAGEFNNMRRRQNRADYGGRVCVPVPIDPKAQLGADRHSPKTAKAVTIKRAGLWSRAPKKQAGGRVQL